MDINAGPLLENIWLNNMAKLKELGVVEPYRTLKLSEVDRYMMCPHCGAGLQKTGFGTHQRGIQCFAVRNALYARLQGYAPCLNEVPYCSYTSPFIKRFMTRAVNVRQKSLLKKKRVQLGVDPWCEVWFRRIWAKHTHLEYPPEFFKSLTPEGAEIDTAKCKPKVVINEGFEPIFAGLAKAKRAGSKKQIDAVLGILDLQLAATKE